MLLARARYFSLQRQLHIHTDIHYIGTFFYDYARLAALLFAVLQLILHFSFVYISFLFVFPIYFNEIHRRAFFCFFFFFKSCTAFKKITSFSFTVTVNYVYRSYVQRFLSFSKLVFSYEDLYCTCMLLQSRLQSSMLQWLIVKKKEQGPGR